MKRDKIETKKALKRLSILLIALFIINIIIGLNASTAVSKGETVKVTQLWNQSNLGNDIYCTQILQQFDATDKTKVYTIADVYNINTAEGKITKNAVALSDEDELKKILAHAYVLSKGNENLNSYLDETKNGYIELMANAMVQNFHKGEANTSDFKDGYKRFIKMGLYYITSAKQGAIWGINTSTAGSETFFNLAGHWKRRRC